METAKVETCLVCDTVMFPVIEKDPDGGGVAEVMRCPLGCHLPEHQREEFRAMAEKVILGEP